MFNLSKQTIKIYYIYSKYKAIQWTLFIHTHQDLLRKPYLFFRYAAHDDL